MKQTYLVSIVLFIFVFIVLGCVDNKPTGVSNINIPAPTPTPSPTPSPTPTPKLYIDMDFQQFLQTMQSNKVTILQKQNLYNSSIGKYVRYNGEIIEVTSNSIELNYIDNWKFGNLNRWTLFVTKDQISGLASFNKGDKITFQGMITKQSFPYAENGVYSIFQLFNGEIISKE